jgi:hypothetical protein
VALARKLLIALWRLVTTGEIPHGVTLHTAASPAACTTEIRGSSSTGRDNAPRWQ